MVFVIIDILNNITISFYSLFIWKYFYTYFFFVFRFWNILLFIFFLS